MKKPIVKQPGLTIGQLAKAADVNVETIRYYQRIGLITEPEKPGQGFRRYPSESLEQIKFIKRAQRLGFSLQEIADLMALGEGNCRDVRERAEQKRNKIEKQIHDLQILRDTLNQLIRKCRGGKAPQCPIVETLLANDETSAGPGSRSKHNKPGKT
jgi:MerR family mercuric resistance operon transcriptional regulator